MMRSFWLSARPVPAPKLKATTAKEAIKMRFIDAPHGRRLLRQVGSSPAAKTPCILPNCPVAVRLVAASCGIVDDGIVRSAGHRDARTLRSLRRIYAQAQATPFHPGQPGCGRRPRDRLVGFTGAPPIDAEYALGCRARASRAERAGQ